MSRRYDLAFFEELNERYRDRPVFSAERKVNHGTTVRTVFTAEDWERRLPSVADRRAESERAVQRVAAALEHELGELSTRSRTERARTAGKLRPVVADIPLAGRDVLELGCGNGWLTEALVIAGEARSAIGIDVAEQPDWTHHRDERLRFVAGDLSAQALLPPESLDVVVSSVVFEHVTRPLQMLSALHTVVRTGGTVWLRFNLYTARNASHRYREIFFPWPHLLFENTVCAEFYSKLIGRPREFSWVNKMTIAHYLQASRDVGFNIDVVRLTRTPIDVEFYRLCEDKLGQYPALDLESDFMTLVLTKAEGNPRDVPTVGYLEAQEALEQELGAQSAPLAEGG